MDQLKGILETLSKHLTQSDPFVPEDFHVLLIWIAVAAIVFSPRVNTYSGILVTVFHEAGHALSALLIGGRLQGIRIHLDHSGTTTSAAPDNLLARLWTGWWGYPFPALVGLCYLWATREGWTGAALITTLLVMSLFFLHSRNIVALASIGATAWATWWALDNWSSSTLSAPLYCLGAFLLIGSIQGLINLVAAHQRGETENSDAAILSREAIPLPSFVWILSFAEFIAWCGVAAFNLQF